MKTIARTLLAGSICLFIALPAAAGRGHGSGQDDIYERLDRQEQRIEQGIRSGEFTRGEAQELKKQQRRIRHLAREFSRDGRLSNQERRILDTELEAASNQIRAFRRNEWEPPRHYPRNYDPNRFSDDGQFQERHYPRYPEPNRYTDERQYWE